MFDDLLMHQTTRGRLLAFAGRPSHALLISGPAGAGKKHTAKILSAGLLGVEPEKLGLHPRFTLIRRPQSKNEIPIDSARQLLKSLYLKVPGKTKTIDRIIIVEDAELLSHEAQNALLKLLEEPPPSTLLILTSSRPQTILPTVVSRLQRIDVLPVTQFDSRAYFSGRQDTADIDSAWRLSSGAPSLLISLFEQGADHPMKLAVGEAKKIILQKPYERLVCIQAAAKDKPAFGRLLDGLSRVLNVLHQANITNQKTADKILASRKAVVSAQESLNKNTNTRLLALNLALSIKL